MTPNQLIGNVLCPTKCMIFNEVAQSIVESLPTITKEQRKMCAIHQGSYQFIISRGRNPIPKCKEFDLV